MKKNISATIIFLGLINFIPAFAAIDQIELDKAEKKGSTYATCSGVLAAFAVVLIGNNDMKEYAIADRRSMGYREYALKTLPKVKVDTMAKASKDLTLAFFQKGMLQQADEFGTYCRYKGFLNKIE